MSNAANAANATAATAANASITSVRSYTTVANSYPTSVSANRISYRAFNSYANKSEDFENVSKIPRNLKKADYNSNNSKKFSLKCKDARLSYKNRRSINKDWKDFNQA
jgi:hypothetical protein